MTHDHASHPQSVQTGGFWRSRYAIGLLVFGAVAGYFLWTEHRAHLAQWWPYAFLLAVTLGASMCFASPFSTPPNALVMKAGHYTFMDYVRIDTHENNHTMQSAITGYGFRKCGNIYASNGTLRTAYDFIRP